ncbi:Uncharacterised protein [Mycobacteroides abscessus subsp. abscessus]|nr:Uncharacterised protein [Mycobacteroides abscessus subsp. abscessus]
MTPLALPVVPEEYGSTARCVAGSKVTCGGARSGRAISASDSRPSTGSTVITPAASIPAISAASSARDSNGDTVKMSWALESISCLASSSAVYNTLTVLAVPPARRMPCSTTAKAEQLGKNTAATSPMPNPRSASPAAVAST